MKNFITNSGQQNLLDRISLLLSNSVELKFLVGFFYFSGLKELYETLQKNQTSQIKVLVGLNVDLLNYQLIEHADEDEKSGSYSNDKIFQKYLKSVKKSINTDNFDTQEFLNQANFFIELIKSGRLVIRKTIKPNHAKLYLFKLQSHQIGRDKLFITGSSNLTYPGLTIQDEFNVEISDYGFEDAEMYFDSLWQESIKITEDDVWKASLLKTLEVETLLRKITPFDAYLYALKVYLDSYEKKDIKSSIIEILEKNGYRILQYQLDAIMQGLSVLEKYNGVILADVVGLGKTIIACSIANTLRKRGLIICPPTLMGEVDKKNSGWLNYQEQFKLYDWRVWSLGNLEKCEEFAKKADDIEVVIIDESHRFRNEDTKSYELLKNICRGRQVILLSATPFNNRPSDILALLKLFVTPKKSNITLEDSLVDKFRTLRGIFDRLAFIKKNHNSSDPTKREKVHNYYKTLFEKNFTPVQGLKNVKDRSMYLAKEIRNVIEPVTIRRNRLDLQNNPDYKEEVKELSKVADPIEWFFELTEEQSRFYDSVIKEYFADPDEGGLFKGAIYRPFEYERVSIDEEKLKERESFEFTSQRNLCDFMRRLLVKRFESSFGAFKQSLVNFKDITETVINFINKTGKYILDRGLIEQISEENEEVIEQKLIEYKERLGNGVYPKNHKIYEINKFKRKDEFIEHIKADLKLFKELIKKLETLKLVEKDPKTECLIYKLKDHYKRDPHRKIIVFSEYADTVVYLQDSLDNAFPGRVLMVYGNIPSYKYKGIYENFDASYEPRADDYDILLCTDKLSEGFNLNRAGMIINYDIPWNPVRVIQRVGRINRISRKVFDELYIINFFPTEKGSEIVKSREIASNKMFLIHNTLGEDSKIFDIDEEPTPSKLYEKIQQNPDRIEEESFYTKALRDFRDIEEKYPEAVARLKNFPIRLKVAKRHTEDELLVFIRKGRLFIHSVMYNALGKYEPISANFEDIYEKIKCDPDEVAISLSEHFWDAYHKARKIKSYRMPLREISLEQQAINNLNSLKKNNKEKIEPYLNFVETLLEDIREYGTLADYTLRRLVYLETTSESKIEKTLKALDEIKEELGEDYLNREKQRLQKLKTEIIIAIENRRSLL